MIAAHSHHSTQQVYTAHRQVLLKAAQGEIPGSFTWSHFTSLVLTNRLEKEFIRTTLCGLDEVICPCSELLIPKIKV